jgi:hypothetical protein
VRLSAFTISEQCQERSRCVVGIWSFLFARSAQGVAFVAIQGLHQLLQQKDRELAVMKRKLDAIEAKLGLK